MLVPYLIANHGASAKFLAGDAANVVTFDRVGPVASAPAPAGLTQYTLMLMGSAIRSVETAGALEAILSLCVAYAGERVAFERPIGKFQAVQQNLARLAGEVGCCARGRRFGGRHHRAGRRIR